jgi:hypothetical protein
VSTEASRPPPSAALPPELAGLNRWGFAFPGPLRDELTALALAGIKTTTAGLLVEMEADGEPVPGDDLAWWGHRALEAATRVL